MADNGKNIFTAAFMVVKMIKKGKEEKDKKQ